MTRNKKAPAPTTFLTIEQVMERGQLSENTVRAIVKRAGLETRPSPRVIRIKLADVERYEDERKSDDVG